MPAVRLPAEPSLEQLRNQAKDLRRAVLAGEPGALAEAAAAPGPFPLHAAQLTVARRHGFPSWARLKRYVEVIERYSRFPDRILAAGPAPATATPATATPATATPGAGPGPDAASSADRFLRLASLCYADDQPERWAQAHVLLAEHPELTAASVHAAAAAADTTALRRILAADPGAARREGGPFRWQPLFYLAYARHDAQIGEDVVLTSARLLLQAGADPNAGYLWHGLPTPFTVLTGVFGEGELGPVRQPRHPHSLTLARLLLQAGADPNDGQALYNRMFEPGNDHLELLLEFGLGTGDGGPWRRRLGAALDLPGEMVRGELAWAITHGMTERVRLLVSHGTDLSFPFEGGATVTSMAATTGHADLIGYLVAHGAPPPGLDPPGAFIAAALAADRASLDRLLRDHPGLAGQVRSARPALITWAAACGRPEAVEILAGLGFDVNAMGRTDVPSDQPWQTALHKAAEDGNLALAQTLLRLGADPDLRDHRFDSTPLGWARYFGHQPLIDLLEPITAPEPP
jgi:ankyrin repeat protein